jgi:hypothetical protein
MSRITTYTCGDVNSQRLYIADLRAYLRHDDSYLHFIKGTLLCFCRRGSARIKVNYTSYSLSDNDILAILPTHVFSIEQCDDSTSIEAILYSDEYWASVSHSIDYGLIRVNPDRNPRRGVHHARPARSP